MTFSRDMQDALPFFILTAGLEGSIYENHIAVRQKTLTKPGDLT